MKKVKEFISKEVGVFLDEFEGKEQENLSSDKEPRGDDKKKNLFL